jgi:hypothetical protein
MFISELVNEAAGTREPITVTIYHKSLFATECARLFAVQQRHRIVVYGRAFLGVPRVAVFPPPALNTIHIPRGVLTNFQKSESQ